MKEQIFSDSVPRLADLTIACPVFNEQALIQDFVRAADDVAGKLSRRYRSDLLIIDDGSTDETPARLHSVTTQYLERIRVVHLARNVGHSMAIQCAIDYLNSPLNLIIDADFQDNPELIPDLLRAYETTNADVVRVSRKGNAGRSYLSPLFALFHWMMRHLTGERDSFGTFGLYTQHAVETLRRFNTEVHYYFPGLVSLTGLKTTVVPSPRSSRRAGESRMGFWRLLNLAFDAFFSFSVFPIRLASLVGLGIMILSIIGISTILYLKLFTPLAIPGWSSILTAVTFFGGINLLFLGIVGEYIGRIFQQMKQRPRYFVASIEDNAASYAKPAD